MKTYEQWEASGVDIDEFLNPIEEVDGEMYDYFSGIVTPRFSDDGVFQVGECEYEENGIRYYMTFWESKGQYYYLGKLPAFKK